MIHVQLQFVPLLLCKFETNFNFMYEKIYYNIIINY